MIKIIQVDFEPKVYQVNMEAGATNLETALEPVGEIVLAIRGMGTFKHYQFELIQDSFLPSL